MRSAPMSPLRSERHPSLSCFGRPSQVLQTTTLSVVLFTVIFLGAATPTMVRPSPNPHPNPNPNVACMASLLWSRPWSESPDTVATSTVTLDANPAVACLLPTSDARVAVSPEHFEVSCRRGFTFYGPDFAMADLVTGVLWCAIRRRVGSPIQEHI